MNDPRDEFVSGRLAKVSAEHVVIRAAREEFFAAFEDVAETAVLAHLVPGLPVRFKIAPQSRGRRRRAVEVRSAA